MLNNSSNNQLFAKKFLFIYLFIHLFWLFIFWTFARSLWRIFSISICVSMFIRENKLLNTRKSEKRTKNNKNNCSIFVFDIFFFFFYRRLKSFVRKINVSINKQFFIEHNVEQYIDNLFDFVKNIFYSIRRFIFDVFSLNEKLKNRSKRLIEHVQTEIKFEKIA